MSNNFEEKLQQFLAKAGAIVATKNNSIEKYTLSKEEGSKYIRIVCNTIYKDGTIYRKEAFCFVEKANGIIWKASTYASPAKKSPPRGCIFDEDSTKQITPYGVKLRNWGGELAVCAHSKGRE